MLPSAVMKHMRQMREAEYRKLVASCRQRKKTAETSRQNEKESEETARNTNEQYKGHVHLYLWDR